jgi:predicted O-linked N-acetylglucosamine transferase (SPINDLY family)
MAFNDAITTPPELATPYFTEKMIYVPHTYYVNSHSHAWGGIPPQHSVDLTGDGEGGSLASALDAAAGRGGVATRGDSILGKARVSREFEGLPGFGPILANFNQFYKIDGPTWDTWMEVLRNAPDASLWLRSEVVDAASHAPPQPRRLP